MNAMSQEIRCVPIAVHHPQNRQPVLASSSTIYRWVGLRFVNTVHRQILDSSATCSLLRHWTRCTSTTDSLSFSALRTFRHCTAKHRKSSSCPEPESLFRRGLRHRMCHRGQFRLSISCCWYWAHILQDSCKTTSFHPSLQVRRLCKSGPTSAKFVCYVCSVLTFRM